MPITAFAEQDPLSKAVFLHLMPGAVQVVAFVLLAPLVMRFGYPVGLAFIGINVFIGIPLMLGYLLYRAKKRSGKLSLGAVIQNRKSMPLWQYAAFFLLMMVIAFTVLFLTSPINEYLSEHTFSWLPEFFRSSTMTLAGEPVWSLVLVMLLLQIVTDGLAVPVVEELYYRGYLMPRIGYLGWAAPAVNAFLFSVQHFWQPFNYLLIFLIVLPQAYLVWRKHNIYISMLTHCAGNIIGAVLSIAAFLTASSN